MRAEPTKGRREGKKTGFDSGGDSDTYYVVRTYVHTVPTYSGNKMY